MRSPQRFQGSRVKGPVPWHCCRDAVPKETFTEFQLAAISSIFIDFRGLDEMSWSPIDFRGLGSKHLCHGIAAEMLVLKKALPDSSWLLSSIH